jgi:type IV secretory pathway VirB9-like protein
MGAHVKRLGWFFCGAMAVACALGSGAWAQTVTTDSRIKTLVYNPNEVFMITTHYGYQSNIEFGPKESIETISLGDRVGWQISPAGRRLFIRAQEENAHTNMTVVTNQRAYQFDLRSSSADAVFGSAELTYVVRFFYPDDTRGGMPPVTMAYAPPPQAAPPVTPPMAAPVMPSPPLAAAPPSVSIPNAGAPAVPLSTPVAPAASMPAPSVVAALPPVTPMFNYRYTYSGGGALAPLKIFDDGRSTFFKFSGSALPRISVISASGELLPLNPARTADGLVAVSVVAPRFTIEQSGQQQVLVYNESNGVL